MQMIRALARCSEEKSILPIEDTETTTPTELRISARGPSFATSSAEAMAVKKATGGQVAQRSEAYPGQRHQKIHQPQRGCVRPGINPRRISGAPAERHDKIRGSTSIREHWQSFVDL